MRCIFLFFLGASVLTGCGLPNAMISKQSIPQPIVIKNDAHITIGNRQCRNRKAKTSVRRAAEPAPRGSQK